MSLKGHWEAVYKTLEHTTRTVVMIIIEPKSPDQTYEGHIDFLTTPPINGIFEGTLISDNTFRTTFKDGGITHTLNGKLQSDETLEVQIDFDAPEASYKDPVRSLTFKRKL